MQGHAVCPIVTAIVVAIVVLTVAGVLAVLLLVTLLPLLGQFPLLCSPVLEPNLDLSLRQGQVLGQLCLPTDRDVLGVVELLFQLHSLVVRVHDSIFVPRSCLACRQEAGRGRRRNDFDVKVRVRQSDNSCS